MTVQWWTRAACKSHPSPELWFPEPGGTVEPARAVCDGLCPVRAECLEWALEHGEEVGVWGGHSPMERRTMKRRTGRKHTETYRPRWPKEVGKHGTHSGYSRGCRCVPCTEANTAYERARVSA